MLLSPQDQQKKWFKLRLRIYAGLLGLAVVLIGGAYVITQTEFFKLRDIKIEGLERLAEKEVVTILRPQIVSGFWGKWLGLDNYLSWRRDLKADSPLLALGKIEKNLFKKTVSLEINELTLAEAWCLVGEQKECYWLDQNGIVMSEAPYPEGHLVKVVFARNLPKPVIGHALLDETAASFVRGTLSALSGINIAIENFVYDAELEEFRVTTGQNNELRFSTRLQLVETIAAALKDIVEDATFPTVEYIDLTVEGRLFVKQK